MPAAGTRSVRGIIVAGGHAPIVVADHLEVFVVGDVGHLALGILSEFS